MIFVVIAFLQVLSLTGIVIALLDIAFAGLLAGHRLIYGPQQEGAMWTLFAVLFFFVGLLFLAIGLIGEYVGRIYLEVRRRYPSAALMMGGAWNAWLCNWMAPRGDRMVQRITSPGRSGQDAERSRATTCYSIGAGNPFTVRLAMHFTGQVLGNSGSAKQAYPDGNPQISKTAVNPGDHHLPPTWTKDLP